MSCEHIMVDLETMGTRPGCAIVSIGAVMFDPQAGIMGDTLYLKLTLEACVAAGLTMDPGTVLWWLDQSEEARKELKGAGLTPANALLCLTRFIESHKARYFWSHGANFDGPILQGAYEAVALSTPWKFWDARDTRTLYDLARVKPDRAVGTHHNALADAESQTRAVLEAYRRLGLSQESV